jgi:hypothetical protein
MNLRTLMATAGATIALTGASVALEASPAFASPTAGSRAAAELIANSALAFSASVQASALPSRYQFDGRVRGRVDGTMSSRITGLSRRSGSIWNVQLDWTVATATGSFTAHTAGTFDARTDRIAVSGPIDLDPSERLDLVAVGQISDRDGAIVGGILEVVPARAA